VLKDEIAIFTKVLHKSRVTSRRLGRDKSLSTSFPRCPPLFSNFFRYTRESENMAVSLPEKKAESSTNNSRYIAMGSTIASLPGSAFGNCLLRLPLLFCPQVLYDHALQDAAERGSIPAKIPLYMYFFPFV